MELKTYDDFNKHWFKRVYAFDTKIQRDEYTKFPYFDFVKEGELVCTYECFGDEEAHYEIRKYDWEENNRSLIYWIEITGQDGVIKGNNIKIFTEEKEANNFADKYRKDHEDELKRIAEHVEKCTVTRLQIAEKFGIPVNDLVIDLYS